nr:uncharacterized protein LOC112073110 isoform X2 [Salvelinus alpinus]
MERRERSTEQSDSTDLDHILKGLDSMSECLDRLALRTQLRQCDLIVCFSHPDKMASLNRVEQGVTWPKTGPQAEE